MLKEAKKNIEESINTEITKGVKMNGAVSKIKMTEVYLDKNHLLLRTKINGSLKIKME